MPLICYDFCYIIASIFSCFAKFCVCICRVLIRIAWVHSGKHIAALLICFFVERSENNLVFYRVDATYVYIKCVVHTSDSNFKGKKTFSTVPIAACSNSYNFCWIFRTTLPLPPIYTPHPFCITLIAFVVKPFFYCSYGGNIYVKLCTSMRRWVFFENASLVVKLYDWRYILTLTGSWICKWAPC